jgi:Xaa-Pro aminopeptidase
MRNSANLCIDSRYWVQAENEIDDNWTLVRAGASGAPQDQIEWLVVCFLHLIW